jgi:hypothetical protein
MLDFPDGKAHPLDWNGFMDSGKANAGLKNIKLRVLLYKQF